MPSCKVLLGRIDFNLYLPDFLRAKLLQLKHEKQSSALLSDLSFSPFSIDATSRKGKEIRGQLHQCVYVQLLCLEIPKA